MTAGERNADDQHEARRPRRPHPSKQPEDAGPASSSVFAVCPRCYYCNVDLAVAGKSGNPEPVPELGFDLCPRTDQKRQPPGQGACPLCCAPSVMSAT